MGDILTKEALKVVRSDGSERTYQVLERFKGFSPEESKVGATSVFDEYVLVADVDPKQGRVLQVFGLRKWGEKWYLASISPRVPYYYRGVGEKAAPGFAMSVKPAESDDPLIPQQELKPLPRVDGGMCFGYTRTSVRLATGTSSSASYCVVGVAPQSWSGMLDRAHIASSVEFVSVDWSGVKTPHGVKP